MGGFTLVEVVVVMIIVGILAVVVLPRFVDRLGFDTRGFADQLRSALGLARKAAVAQRRNVCVAFTASSVSATQASAAGQASPCVQPLVDPATGAALALAAPVGVTLAASSGITFSALGEPLGALANVTITVSGDGSQLITVEQGTGHVH